MRIDSQTRDIIKSEVAACLGTDVVVRLFGSRADDNQRGGDIDLLIDVDNPLKERILTECHLEARLFIRLGGRKVDVLIRDPNKPPLPVHQQALKLGIVL